MAGSKTTQNLTRDHRANVQAAQPGALVLWSGDEPRHVAIPLARGSIELGREPLQPLGIDDGRLSRKHALCEWTKSGWRVSDQGSRNGTVVDGVQIGAAVETGVRCLVRIGDTLVWLIPDIAPFVRTKVTVENGLVTGPTMRAVFDQVRLSAQGKTLHVTGNSGAGKEMVARAFHTLGPAASGPFIAVNCATIPEGVAERVLFGARKGAYTGAETDSIGHVREADGGTLFLDEVGELSLAVQAKLLRALESSEVTPLGASRSIKVSVRFCSATHQQLQDAVAARTFREDLYFRLGRPAVRVPALCERVEEIAWHVSRTAKELGGKAHVSLVEECLLRPWPGNVRELKVEVTEATRRALADGRDGEARRDDLDANAGKRFVKASPAAPGDPDASARPRELPSRDHIEAALKEHGGRVASAARALGLHRNQLRRWLVRNRVDPASFGDPGAPAGHADDADGADSGADG
ncbi:MAG: sigma-54-dependent Fis family transcriptional regulator [Deltaproteobacteria bacterium]|nr:sigma-54-dependent Fis family transcriptional regulator [Deltaproteobacteria bacterium]